jgi:hypothetical protein
MDEETFVFNVVWTGSVFTYLRSFVASQMHYCGARYRFVANGCPAEQIGLMEQFRAKHPDRVVEVLETSGTMVPHGFALDAVLEQRDDGPFFCMVDADILALGPFLSSFAQALEHAAAITSGRGIWHDDDVIPPGHPGVAGEYFYSQDGFLFGSPHFAMYRREALDATMRRWGVSFAEAGKGMSDEARARLAQAGHDYFIYDTGKLVNIFLQENGYSVAHEEHENLMHIGGLSHYLSPTGFVTNDGEVEPDWSRWRGMASRFEVARFTAAVVRDLSEGRVPPRVPDGLSADMTRRLERVHDALVATIPKFVEPLGEVAT